MKRLFFLFFVTLMLSSILRGESVVLIHGFMSDAHSMSRIQTVLANCQFCVYPWRYPSHSKFFGEHACNLLKTLQFIASQAPGEPIDFVAHSSGALILRLALNMPGCPEEAKMGRAVLLGPSNRGSQLARRFCGFRPLEWVIGNKSGWELMHYQPCQIDCFGDFPSSMQVLVIAGTKGNTILFKAHNDGWLTVDETYLRTAYCFKTFPLSHGELLYKREPLICLRAFLTQNP